MKREQPAELQECATIVEHRLHKKQHKILKYIYNQVEKNILEN